VTEPVRHFPEDLVRTHAVGAASQGASLAVACHLAYCAGCRRDAAAHEAMLDALLDGTLPAGEAPPERIRQRLLGGDLPPRPQEPRPLPTARLPEDLPPLPPALARQLERLGQVRWRRLLPGIRAIDLGVGDAWRARLIRFRPGISIPLHDHGGPEHTVVFSGGLDDQGGHLGRGDAATMMPGDRHRQRTSPGEPCLALIVSEAPARPLTLAGRVLQRLTRS
jgi:putative transcriptional regulator